MQEGGSGKRMMKRRRRGRNGMRTTRGAAGKRRIDVAPKRAVRCGMRSAPPREPVAVPDDGDSCRSCSAVRRSYGIRGAGLRFLGGGRLSFVLRSAAQPQQRVEGRPPNERHRHLLDTTANTTAPNTAPNGPERHP